MKCRMKSFKQREFEQLHQFAENAPRRASIERKREATSKVANENSQTRFVSFFPKKPDHVPADLAAGNAGSAILPSKDSTSEGEESEKPDFPNEWVSEEMHFTGKD